MEMLISERDSPCAEVINGHHQVHSGCRADLWSGVHRLLAQLRRCALSTVVARNPPPCTSAHRGTITFGDIVVLDMDIGTRHFLLNGEARQAMPGKKIVGQLRRRCACP